MNYLPIHRHVAALEYQVGLNHIVARASRFAKPPERVPYAFLLLTRWMKVNLSFVA